MPARIVRNEEGAANYGRWVAGLRREATRMARARHKAGGRAARSVPAVTEQNAHAARHARVSRKTAIGAPGHRIQRPRYGHVEAAVTLQNRISAWLAAGLRRPRAELTLKSALLLAGLVLALCALGMVGNG